MGTDTQDIACRPTDKSGEKVWTDLKPDQCDPTVTYANEKTTIQWKISREFTLQATENIRRRKCGCIVVECEYATAVDAALAPAKELTIKEKKVTMVGKKSTGTYELVMKFTKSDYSADPDSYEIGLNADVFVKIGVKGTDFQKYKIQAKECFASPSINKADKDPSYPLLKTGCRDKAAWETDKNARDLDTKERGPTIQFSFKSFVWAKSDAAKKIFVHCSVQVCVETANACVAALAAKCSKKKKRALTVNTNDKVRPEEHDLALGPLYVHKENEIRVSNGTTLLPCQINNGGCSEICVNSFGTGHICACRPGRVLTDDGYSCMDTGVLIKLAEQPQRQNDVSTKATSHEAVMIVSAVAIITILNIIAVIVIVSRKGKKYPV